jgi:hypothetical protein
MVSGRRGVLDTGASIRIIEKKRETKDKFFKFAEKFGGAEATQGVTFASLRDLV